MRKIFFMDLDDTLMPNSHYYKIQGARAVKIIVGSLFPEERKARRACRRLIGEVIEQGYRVEPLKTILSQDVNDETGILERIVSLEETIDIQNLEEAKKRGESPYHRNRFPGSWRDTYLHFCKEKGVAPDESTAQMVYDTASKFWDIKPDLMWGAARVLDFLVEKGDELHILTKGDSIVQFHKLNVNRLERWVPEKNWHIVSDKDPEIFRNVSWGMGLSSVYMVGNSQKSDINPAIEAGANGIYLPFYTWVHEESDEFSVEVKERYALGRRGEVLILENSRRVFKLPNIIDIIEIYKEL